MLPGVDDGSPGTTETRAMLKIAYEDGIRGIMFTPHWHIGKATVPKEEVQRQTSIIRAYAKENYPGMRFRIGHEIYYYSKAVDELYDGKILPLANTDMALFEFSPSCQYVEIRDCIRETLSAGFVPVIAHFERYACVMEKLSRVEEIKEMGAKLQVNAGSLSGRHGKTEMKDLLKLAKNGLVDFVGTDAHNSKLRPPVLSEGYEAVLKKCGSETAEKIFFKNPSVFMI